MSPRLLLPRTWLIVLLLVLLPCAQPCGPSFNDAHHGLLQDALLGSLETFYAQLVRPGTSLEKMNQEFAKTVEQAREQEQAARWDDALHSWRQAILTIGFDARAVHAWETRDLRDRIDLLPLVDHGISPEEMRSYLAAAATPGERWAPRQSTFDLAPLQALAASGNVHLACAALTTLGWRKLESGQVADALTDLTAAAARDPASVKQEEISYLSVVAPLFAHLDTHLQVDDPAGTLARIEAWMVAHPASPWRPHALSWQAALLFENPALGWKGDADGVLAATRIWQGLLSDPADSELFTSAVESLRLAYRRLRPSPPAWVLADPRHAVAFAWHAVTDRVHPDERAAILSAVEPALVHLADGKVDADLLRAVAEVWMHEGRYTVALPLALRSLALKDAQETRYLIARLCAETGDPGSAEAIYKPPANATNATNATNANADFDLLTRIGSAWEAKQEWANALAAYERAASWEDVGILCEEVMPVSALEPLVSGRPAPSAADAAPGNIANLADGRPHAADLRANLANLHLANLRSILAVRLVRADRPADALAYFDDSRRGLCAALIALQDDLKQAPEAKRAQCLYTLALFWYDQGKNLVYLHDALNWSYYDAFRKPKRLSPGLLAARARYVGEMESMAVYYRAYPLFLEIADRFPKDAHAPEALYKAALCRYWLTGWTYMGQSAYWQQRSRDEHYWDQGDALLRRLAATYPADPLATDPKVLRALGLPPAK